ncbi:MAG: selenocysteine-specific translation elongation factor [Thermaerobacter sp.]|nr:selenocysteine-specific translation elongation factor [Thermaerobacter sp.]
MVFGTAGHIDHGKTTLVRALTGRDTDRLPEEKRRGISIDLGFAPLTLPSGRRAAFVDVPGHERFIRNMVAGVHGMDAVLLVVAATEGVMPQTVEHLAILDFLGVSDGLVVLTKADLVEADWLDLVATDTRATLAGSFLGSAPILAVGTPSGRGMPLVLAELDRLASVVRPRDAGGVLRLPVDRVFSVRGFGTVVTGTLTRGTLRTDEAVELAPGGPRARVRGLESHGEVVTFARAGQRVAVNLSGVDRAAVVRGQVLTHPGQLDPVTVAAVELTLLPDAPALKHRGRVHTYVGTAEALARVYFWDRDALAPGSQAWAELRWEEPVVLQRGDRVLIRTYSPVVTVGGGVVAEVGVHHRRREPNLLARLDEQLAGDPLTLLAEGLVGREAPLALDQAARQLATPLEDLSRVVGERPDITLIAGRWVWSPTAARRVADRVREVVTAYHREHPLRSGWPRERQKQEFPEWDPRLFGQWVAAVDGVELEGDVLRRTGFQVELSEAQAAWRAEIREAVRGRGLEPPDLAWVLTRVSAPEDRVRDVVEWMVAQGELVRLGDQLLVDGGVYAEAIRAIAAALAREGPLGTAALRDVLGTTRKYAVPLLERMDEARVTRREGDVRVLVQS